MLLRHPLQWFYAPVSPSSYGLRRGSARGRDAATFWFVRKSLEGGSWGWGPTGRPLAYARTWDASSGVLGKHDLDVTSVRTL